MGTPATSADERDLPQLLGEVVRHSETLLSQQLEVFRAEAGQKVREAGGAALALAAGAGLCAAGGVLATAAAVHLLQRVTKLPLWANYALAAGAAGAAGAGLIAAGRRRAAQIQRPLLPQTAASLRDNVTWLRNQLTAGPT